MKLFKRCTSQVHTRTLQSTFKAMLLLAGLFLFSSCNKELPVAVNGKVFHAISGEPMSGIEVSVKNIICSGFSPVVCEHVNLKEQTNAKGEFSFNYFQECETEICANLNKESGFTGKKRFVYNVVAGPETDLSCNEYPKLYGDEGYYLEIFYQPIIYVDIYAVDDPNLELTKFSFNNQQLGIVKSSHFQQRFKVDIEKIKDNFIFTTEYANADRIQDVVNYDYNQEDHIIYELRY